jgi:hypothetical protein
MTLRRPWRSVATSAAAAGILVVASVGDAAAATVRVVVRDRGDPFVARLVPELRQLGFDVTTGAAGATDAAGDPILEISDRVDLRDAAPDGSTRTRRLTASKDDALKVAEEVHALLLPLVASPAGVLAAANAAEAQGVTDAARAAPDRPPTRVSREPSESSSRSMELSAGAGALFGSSAAGVGVTGSMSVLPRSLRVGRASLGLGIGGLVAVIPESFSSAAGSANVRAFMVGPEAIARFELAPRLLADVALGAWVTHVRFEGTAVAPFTSLDTSLWALSPGARLRGQLALGTVGLFLEGRGGITTQEIAVRFAGESVGIWGRPWVCLGGGVAFAP